MTRTFTARPAVREHVPLLIGLIGPSSSGKTKSALLLAEGIQSVVGGKIYGIDTEARRMAHYADQHKFEHVEFDPPFGSLDYLQVIQWAVSQGAKTVIIDSMTHEHEGPGGMIDFQEKELDRIGGNDYAKRERVKMLAWQKPKAARRQLITGLLQLNANFIFCFRAREKAKPVKKNGKTEIENMGFMPIAGEEFLFEQTVNCLLLPKSGGVPTWRSDQIGERMMMKVPNYLEHAFPEGEPLSRSTGRLLAEWARGGTPAPKSSPPDQPASRPASSDQAPQDGAGQDFAELDDETRASMADMLRDTIESTITAATDAEAMLQWWSNPAQMRQREQLLTEDERKAFHGKLIARRRELMVPA